VSNAYDAINVCEPLGKLPLYVQTRGLVVPLQLALSVEPPSTLKVTAPVGADPAPVQASVALSVELAGKVTVATLPSVNVGLCWLTLKLVWAAEAAE
jgi:hypothetical protein